MITGPSLEIESRDWVASPYPMSSIAAHVGLREQEEGFSELRDQIVQVGMKYPIVLLENSFENYVGCSQNVRPECILPFDPEKAYIAAAGNQRIEIAKELEVEYMDAILAPDLNWAFSILSEIRQREV
jgi:hypothetical protein